jgi:hypothetical protein
MSTDDGGNRMEFVLDEGNTFGALPGAMTAVTCPACLRQQLLKEVIDRGECTACGTTLELTLSATD